MKTLSKLHHKVLMNAEEANLIVSERKKEGKSIVFTNGCFDILHKGHVEYLAKAADLGDVLVVALNTDASVKNQGKGEERPINKQDDRLEMLAALFFVDYVLLFNGDTPIEEIKTIVPNVLVKGGDYDPSVTDTASAAYIVGREFVLKHQGSVKVIDLVAGYSTTNIVQRLKGE
ncbi:D-glycero-beta-D-manno-heptose 1-phosphate adenylyltransferase [Putridiphycobacter roseus]|uniref:D-glycero-beta-D-manno-heptose 1-phosphate adenylyltransferase n=1 Tax=Putridiphycobacter roseus TaxID=2219161 RepID=A0A2W1ND14_9FLAO|nr:adenylyltransferase/cytidyltransferase family protein [Putridiphycobacter roseus]PZE16993.1 D-glycero-beta-D-manno-heptose 1-phosphate adenylyltransferase [Putridiphycobacter roseus]